MRGLWCILRSLPVSDYFLADSILSHWYVRSIAKAVPISSPIRVDVFSPYEVDINLLLRNSSCKAPIAIMACRNEGSAVLACNTKCSQNEEVK